MAAHRFASLIDGNEITRYAQRTLWSPRFNLLDSGTVRFPRNLVGITPGVSELSLVLDGSLVFSGPCWYSQSEGNPDSAYTEVTGWDHRIYFGKRMCKTGAGNLITPNSVLLSNVTAPEIFAAFIANTESFDPGTLPIAAGSVDSGGVDVSGSPMQWPMTLARMLSLLTSTGQLDQILHPGIGSSTVDLLNDYDNDSGASYEYATGAHNCQIATVTVDMKDVRNAIWYLLAPRISSTRWKGSITPTAPHPGGSWPGSLVSRFMGSRALYGYMQDIQTRDVDDANDIRPLYEEEWANEAWIAAVPRTFASIRPQRGLAPAFRVGDLINVAAGPILNGGFSGQQMVYGFDLSCDADGVLEIEEILASADQIGV